MGEKGIIAVHIKAAEEYLEAARKLIGIGEYFASVLCAATGAERASMAIIFQLGGRPATRHRHHEILKTLQPLIKKEGQLAYQETVEALAELMGHLTMVRYKYDIAGEYKTPKEIYDKATAQRLYGKAERVLRFSKNLVEI